MKLITFSNSVVFLEHKLVPLTLSLRTVISRNLDYSMQKQKNIQLNKNKSCLENRKLL